MSLFSAFRTMIDFSNKNNQCLSKKESLFMFIEAAKPNSENLKKLIFTIIVVIVIAVVTFCVAKFIYKKKNNIKNKVKKTGKKIKE